MTDKKPIQCCYCKTNSDYDKDIKFFNLEEYEASIVANGCSNCKNYNDVTYG